MGLNVGNLPVTEVYVGSTPVQAVYVGAKMVWSPTTVQITLGAQYEARYQLLDALSARGLDHATVTEIPFDIELVGSGSAYQLFDSFEALTHAPAMDTSQVTDMAYMFNRCSSLTHVPEMDTSSVTTMISMFYDCASLTDGNVRLRGRHPDVITSNMILFSGLTREPFVETVQITLGTSTQASDQLRAALTARGLDYWTVTRIPFDIELVGTGATRSMFNGCSSLTTVPDLDTSQVANMETMFSGCSSLTHVPEMDTSSVTTMISMFYDCASLTDVPDMDTSSVTTMSSMFENCALLTHVPEMNTSNVTDASYMFYDCASLTDGNVRLIGRNPSVVTEDMIVGSGLTRDPFYDADGNPV